MTKNEIIEKLQAIDGNPEIFIKESDFGNTHPVGEIEEALVEKQGKDIFTFSIDEPEELGITIDQKCIVIWI